jgi:N-acetylmuramoyl-L-alanine amidase
MMLQGANRYPVEEAVLHCAAVPSGWYMQHRNDEVVSVIRRWHVQRGWRDIGYHYVITPDGEHMTGRPADQIGAGVVGHNRGVLHILMIERFQVNRIGKFHDYFTEKQRDTVRKLCRTFGITQIRGHNDYAPKLCPGFKVKADFFL